MQPCSPVADLATPALCADLAPAGVAAQDSRLQALRLDDEEASTFRLDGALDESFWQQAEAVRQLRQQEPVSGASASERTEILWSTTTRRCTSESWPSTRSRTASWRASSNGTGF